MNQQVILVIIMSLLSRVLIGAYLFCVLSSGGLNSSTNGVKLGAGELSHLLCRSMHV